MWAIYTETVNLPLVCKVNNARIVNYGMSEPLASSKPYKSSCFATQVRNSSKTPLMTCLLEGPPGTGKTALAATVGIDSDFPFVKVISAENYVGWGEQAKCSAIAKVFDDAYKVRADPGPGYKAQVTELGASNRGMFWVYSDGPYALEFSSRGF